ncbi:MAG TPA: DRTGG domain-containing protein [Clostridiales bacterium]|nr:DRTGG domain-containing protein [Clostridiales bacterium]
MAKGLNLTFLCGKELAQREVTGCYCGDLLSFVMSRAKSGDAWLTVMGHLNSIGVAALTDAACIVLTENAPLDPQALERAMQNDIIVLRTDRPTYETAVALSDLFKED